VTVDPPQVKPALKWAGGKSWLVPHMAPLWREHRHRRLVEPFCGGLAVTLGLLPENALLNDINPRLEAPTAKDRALSASGWVDV
jgi:DNA adenine methylase